MRALLLAGCLACTQFSMAQQGTLLAVSKVDHMLAIVDPVTLKVKGRVPIGPDPHEVVAAPDGKIAYVSNPGYGAFHEINVIDLTTLKALPNIETMPLYGPHGMAYVQGKLWFTAQGSKSVGRYDPVIGKVEWSMGTGQNVTHMIHVTADAKRFYTTNVESGTVSIYENVLLQPTVPPTGVLPAAAKPRMDWIQTLVPVGMGDEGFDVAPDGKELWTVTPRGTLVIVDVQKKALDDSIAINLPGAHRLGFTPDGKHVLIVSVRTGDVVIYDAKTRKETKRINVGHGAAMLMQPDGKRAFISCTPDNYIAVIDLGTMEMVGKLEIGGRPDGLAWVTKE